MDKLSRTFGLAEPLEGRDRRRAAGVRHVRRAHHARRHRARRASPARRASAASTWSCAATPSARRIESFETDLDIAGARRRAACTRCSSAAPVVESVGPAATPLAALDDGRVVAVRAGQPARHALPPRDHGGVPLPRVLPRQGPGAGRRPRRVARGVRVERTFRAAMPPVYGVPTPVRPPSPRSRLPLNGCAGACAAPVAASGPGRRRSEVHRGHEAAEFVRTPTRTGRRSDATRPTSSRCTGSSGGSTGSCPGASEASTTATSAGPRSSPTTRRWTSTPSTSTTRPRTSCCGTDSSIARRDALRTSS